MLDFAIPIFPQGSLAGSVTTTVWIGACVVCFFNLRLGWVLSGLVVPGYLIPLIMTRPWSATVIIIEGFITYCIVRMFSHGLPRLGFGYHVFGRDRFFALLAVSVLVRIFMDTWLLPEIGEYITNVLGIAFDYRNNLHSYGLIVVALIANGFWKPGPVRGALVLAVVTGVTYIIVRYGLMVFTNFSIGKVAYIYEDLSISMLASPKSYIILLTSAYIASRMNLHYGWEFNGILIPALLALQWYQPFKIFATFLETFAILICAILLLKLPAFKHTGMQGAQKILLFFNIGFLYKLVMGYIILLFFPEYRVSDYYGFGYLLSTLLAIKIHDKDIAAKLTRATLQTSLLSVILASGIGFTLTLASGFWQGDTGVPAYIQARTSNLSDARLIDIIREDKIRLFKGKLKNSFVQPSPREMNIFGQAVQILTSSDMPPDAGTIQRAQRLLIKLGYCVETVQDRYLYISEFDPLRHWGIYVIDTAANNKLLVEVPAPIDEWAVLEAGTQLFTAFQAGSLAVSGTGRRTNDDGNSDVLGNPNTIFSVFHRETGMHQTLQVRGHTAETMRILDGNRNPVKDDKSSPNSVLWVRTSIPIGINLPLLREFIGDYKIKWGSPPIKNVIRDRTTGRFAELILTRPDRRKILFKPLFGSNPVFFQERDQSIVGYLQGWLLGEKGRIAEKGSLAYVPPKIEDLLFWHDEIATPLIRVSRNMYDGNKWTSEGLAELRSFAPAAALFGYRLIRYHHKTTGKDYLVLIEKDDTLKKGYWGFYILRLGQASGYVIQVPRPLSEINVFEFAISLFERLGARALFVGGAHPMANEDGSADLVRTADPENIFNLMTQVILREYPEEPMLVIQCRAMGIRPENQESSSDVLISFDTGTIEEDSLGPEGRQIITALRADGLSLRFVDGKKDVVGYETGGIPQARYINQTDNKCFTLLWISHLVRTGYRQQTGNLTQEKQFCALGVPTYKGELFDFLASWKKSGAHVSDTIREKIRKYVVTQDIVVLENLLFISNDFEPVRILDINSRQAFLMLREPGGDPVLIANLFPRDPDRVFRFSGLGVNRRIIDDFVANRAALLEYRGDK